MDDAQLETTNRLLRVVIALMLRASGVEVTAREKIETLNELGLRPTEIATILGRPATYVNKELAGIRKKSKR